MRSHWFLNILCLYGFIYCVDARTETPTPTPTLTPEAPQRYFQTFPDPATPNAPFRFRLTHPRDRPWSDTDQIGFAPQQVSVNPPVPGRRILQEGYWRATQFDCSGTLLSTLEVRRGVPQDIARKRTITWTNVVLPPGQYAVCYSMGGAWFDANGFYYPLVVKGPVTYHTSPTPVTVDTDWSLVVFGVLLGVGDQVKGFRGDVPCENNSADEVIAPITVSAVNQTSDAVALTMEKLPEDQTGTVTMCYRYGDTGWYKLTPNLAITTVTNTATVDEAKKDTLGDGLWWKLALLIAIPFLLICLILLLCVWCCTRQRTVKQRKDNIAILQQAEETREIYGDGSPFDPPMATGPFTQYGVVYYHANLKVTVVEVKNLPNRDAARGNDPLVELLMARGESWQTSIKTNAGDAATWNESFELSWDPKKEFMLCTVYDRDVMSSEKIGSALIRPTVFLRGSRIAERWLPLSGTKYGELKLRIEVIGGVAVKSDGTQVPLDPAERRALGQVPPKSPKEKADAETNTQQKVYGVDDTATLLQKEERPTYDMAGPAPKRSSSPQLPAKRDSATAPEEKPLQVDEATNVHLENDSTEPTKTTMFGVPVASLNDQPATIPDQDEYDTKQISPTKSSSSPRKAQRTSHWFEKHQQLETKYPALTKSLDSNAPVEDVENTIDQSLPHGPDTTNYGGWTQPNEMTVVGPVQGHQPGYIG
eukprot:TRINITY_DN94589_c0_g1_i1.p1 TRINITY_DN94589_c0_g1~~TRINITY_DN94589_c0_g1_i1.p1  ORF type:complete len:705 (-),score=56.90 TRINITY_DN94589_c0_g1_i1:171-2285(-)